MADVLMSLDLGKLTDSTAGLSALRSRRVGPDGRLQESVRGDNLYRYEGFSLKRWPLRTDYTAIIRDVGKQLENRCYPDPTRLILDATGVGVGVVEMFRNARLPKVQIIPVTIKAEGKPGRIAHGRGLTGWSVTKRELAASTQAAIMGGHIRFSRDEPLAQSLIKEFLDFQVKISDSGREQFEHRSGQHDDLLLAVMMMIWVGDRPQEEYWNNAASGMTAREQGIVESRAIAEAKAENEREEAERVNREKEWHSNWMADHWYY